MPSLISEGNSLYSSVESQYKIYINSLHFKGEVRTDVRLMDVFTTKVLEAKRFNTERDSQEVKDYIKELQEKYPGVKLAE